MSYPLANQTVHKAHTRTAGGPMKGLLSYRSHTSPKFDTKKVCHFSVVWPSLCLTQWAKMFKQQGRTETSMTHNHINLCQYYLTTICRIHFGEMIKKGHHKVPRMSIVNITRTSSCRVLYMLKKHSSVISGGLPANIRKFLENIHLGWMFTNFQWTWFSEHFT